MTRTEILLLTAVTLLSGVLVGVIVLLDPGSFTRLAQSLAPLKSMEVGQDGTDAPPSSPPLPPAPPEPVWRPMERLEYALGPWRTEEGEVLAALAFREVPVPEGGPAGAPIRAWTLTVEWDEKPALVCDLYEDLQMPDPSSDRLPWRLAYCRGRDLDISLPPTPTRVTLLRATGVEYIRLILGTGLDVYLHQVH